MASLEQINLGNVANDGTGDPVRTAFQKTNNNSTALNAIGIGNTTLAFTGNAITSSSGIDLTLNGGNLALGPAANLHITGGTNFQFLQANGNTGGVFWGNGVGGNPTQIQYNKGNQFAGNSRFTYNDSNNTVSVDNISAQTGAFSDSVSVANGLTVGGTTILQNLQVNGTATIVNSTQAQTGNLTLQLGANIGNAGNVLSNSLVNDGGIILGNNITGGNVSMLYSSASNAWVFSRPLVSGNFNSASFASGVIQSTEADFNILNANIGAVGLLDSNFVNIFNPSEANGLANSPTSGTVLNLENTANGNGQGYVGIKISSNTVLSNTNTSTRAGAWNIYTEAVTGNLTFAGSYANANVAPISLNGIVFGKDGKIYSNGVYDASGNAIAGNPSGGNFQLQYNYNNQFSANSGLTYNPVNGYLTVTNINVLGNVLQNNNPIAVGVSGYDTTVQYNNNGLSAGSNNFRFISTSNVVNVTGNIVTTPIYSTGATSVNPALGSQSIGAVAYGVNSFLAGAADGSFSSSLNGSSWANTGNNSSQNIAIRNLTFYNNTWVSVQTANLSTPTQIWTSPLAGNAWTRVANVSTSMFINDLETVTLNNQTIVLGAGNDNNNGYILYGSNLSNLSTATAVNNAALYGVDSNGTIAVAVGIVGTGATANAVIVTATTPNVWTQTGSNLFTLYGNSQTLFDVAWGSDRFVAVGSNPNVTLYSTDGLTWSSARSNTNTTFNRISFNDGLFIAVGNSGNIWTTRDGLGWQQLSTGNTRSLNDIVITDSRFVAVGANGTTVTAGLSYDFGGFYQGNGRFLTGIVSSDNLYSNANVANYLPVYGGNVLANVVNGNVVNGNTVQINSTGNLNISSNSNIVLSPTGNVIVQGNITTTGNVTTTANVTSRKIIANGVGDLLFRSDSNIVLIPNANTNFNTWIASNLLVSGNTTANYYFGNGAYLTGISGNAIVGGYGNSNVAAFLASNSNVTITVGVANITTQGNVKGSNLVVEGSNSVLLIASNSGIVLQPSAGNNVSVIGNVNANYYLGNGAFLTGITSGNLANLTSNVTTTANISGNYILGNGRFLTGISTGTTVSPGGSNTQIQFNSNGAFAGVNSLTYSKFNDTTWTVNSSVSGNGTGTGSSYRAMVYKPGNVLGVTGAYWAFGLTNTGASPFRFVSYSTDGTTWSNVGGFNFPGNSNQRYQGGQDLITFGSTTVLMRTQSLLVNGFDGGFTYTDIPYTANSTVANNVSTNWTFANPWPVGSLAANAGPGAYAFNSTSSTLYAFSAAVINSGGLSSNLYAYTTNGTTWTTRRYTGNIALVTTAATYGNGRIVVLNQGTYTIFGGNLQTTAASNCAVSTDGINWVEGTLPSAQQWGYIGYSNGKFLALPRNWGSRPASANGAVSVDGITWTAITMPFAANITVGGTYYTNWTILDVNNEFWVMETITNGATNGAIQSRVARSADGINWTQGPNVSPTGGQFTTATYGNNKILAFAGGITSVTNTATINVYANLNFTTSDLRFSGATTNGQILTVTNSTTGQVGWLNANTNIQTYLPTYSGNVGGNIQLTQFSEAYSNVGNVSGIIAPNAAISTIYNYTLTGNITLNSINNVSAGTSMTIILTQDATGNRLLTSNWKFASNVRTLTTTANATDIISVFYSGTQYYASLTQGYV